MTISLAHPSWGNLKTAGAKSGLSLLKRNWLQEIKLKQIAHANGVTKGSQPKLERILDKYRYVFTAELGHYKGVKAKLHVPYSFNEHT